MLKCAFICCAAITAMMTLLVGHSFAAENYPPLPETVTSFGAYTLDGWLYVFGGHKGERHDYSEEMVSGSFQRLKLNGGQTWEALPSSIPGQGLALVAKGHYLYRIGGMAARNHENKKQDLYSLDVVQRFDLKSKSWENIAPLPQPRSSHDAAILNNRIYVAGGWDLTGGTNKAIWHTNALVLDIHHPQDGWKEFPQPFKRRAVALAVVGSEVFCIGGMDSDNNPTSAVNIYNTMNGQWTEGPNLPKGKYEGFSCSAIAQHGRIYVTMFKDELLRLSSDEHSWEVVGKLETPRLAHRLVTDGKKQLIMLGGENGQEEKTPDLEVLSPSAKPMAEVNTTQSPAQLH
jgi:N-acetylneuraminic acid mutarotase